MNPPESHSQRPTSLKRGVIVVVSLLYYIAIGLRGLAMRLFGVAPPPQFVVLYYHSVSAAANFAQQMRAVARVAQVLPADYVGPLDPGQRYVAITFDDALQSIVVHALPVLIQRSFPAAIFVPAGIVGRLPNWEDLEKGGNSLVELEPVMTIEQLRHLPTDLVTLGSHSMTHPRLPNADVARLKEEVAGSRRHLAELLGRPVSLFAFPYGAYDDRVLDECRRAGYERVFSITPLLADPAGEDYVRGRVSVEPEDTALEFFLKMRGAYAWTAQLSRLKKLVRDVRERDSVDSCATQ